MTKPRLHLAPVLISVGLVALVWIVFAQVLGFSFVSYDDGRYVYQNPVVMRGITPSGIGWAFTHVHSKNWHPLTSISHMLDAQFYGLRAGGHHVTNVLLHSLGTVLLFLVLQSMTGAIWRSAVVAAVFAVHPLHVESVAWVAERKDVLSGVFFMLTLWAYNEYARNSSARRYLMVVLVFALGLMSKPMLVTLPFLLLLLDYWPLQRSQKSDWQNETRQGRSLSKLVVEKVPLFALSAASIVATLIAQGGAIQTAESLPLSWRISNAIVSCVTYIVQLLWPTNLAVFYPHPAEHLAFWKVAGSAGFLIVMTMAAVSFRKRYPWLVTGWFWYLGMLVPALGIIQVGSQARADRYTYLPQIGLDIVLVWGMAELLSGWRHRREILSLGSAAGIAALTWLARRQTSYWHDGETLWKRALAVTSGNYVAQNNLGFGLLERGELDEAISRFRSALAIDPSYTDAEYNLANSLAQKNETDEAIAHYKNILRIRSDDTAARTNLANLLLELGRKDEALAEYKKAVEAQPDSATAQYNLGIAFIREGNADQAIPHLERALTIESDYPDAHYSLGNALFSEGRDGDAMAQWRRDLEVPPNNPNSAQMLAWVLATSPNDALRDGAKAVELAERAAKASPDVPAIRTLAAAYAEAGHFADAIATAERGLTLATTQQETNFVDQLNADLEGYRRSVPVRDTGRGR